MQFSLKLFIIIVIFYAYVFVQLENYTYKLTQSTSSYELWTTLPCDRVFKETDIPSETGNDIKVYAARNEFEPFQIIIKSASDGSGFIEMGDFGSGISTELFQVKYVNITTPSDYLGQTGDYPDPLWPLENGSSVSLSAGENTAFWINIFIPEGTTSGDYTANISIAGINVPIDLHVFNFNLPDTMHIKSQMDFSFQNVITKYGVADYNTEFWMYVNLMKQFLKDHRLTPKSVLWPGGLTSSDASPLIDYDCSGNLTDSYGVWGFETPAQWYLDGDTLRNDVGFSSFMAATFTNNDASADQRPATFCSQTRSSGDWYTGDNPASPYNTEWSEYITALQDYLENLNYIDKAYYYIAHNPLDQADYDAVAWYSKLLKNAAPNLKLMLSENPRTEIYDNTNYNSGQIDIWMPVLEQYDPQVSEDREVNHGEVSWIYFLSSTRPPFFNPITLDHPGIESRFTGWLLWKYRIKGIAYYSMNNWDQNPWTDPMANSHNGELFMLYPPSEGNTNISYGSNNHRLVPSIRIELMRDSFEDYEYLHLLNENMQPEMNVTTPADSQVNKIISGVASYTRDGRFMYNLRNLIGQKVGGEISSIPDIEPLATHPRSEEIPGDYYINFQNPDGEPYTTYSEDTYGTGYIYKYMTYAGHDYLQVGTEQYNDSAGFGWRDDVTKFATGRNTGGSETDERKITYVYDDEANHPDIFEFDLPNGIYNVEVCVGTPGIQRLHNRVVIEGITFIDNEASSYNLVHSAEVEVSDYKLTVDIGILNEYTMLNYLNIENVTASSLDSESNVLPVEYALFQNFPNPFNPKTIIRYALPVACHLDLSIYNNLGQRVKTLVNKKQPSGSYKVEWNASGFPSGVYFYRIKAGDFVQTKRMLLIK